MPFWKVRLLEINKQKNTPESHGLTFWCVNKGDWNELSSEKRYWRITVNEDVFASAHSTFET